MDATLRVARVELPLLVLGFDDDPWANRRAMDLLLRPMPGRASARRMWACCFSWNRAATPRSARSPRPQSRRALDELNGHLKAGFSDAELAVVARWLEQVAALEQA